MSVLNPSRYVDHDMSRRRTGDADLPIADTHLFAVEDAKRVRDQMRGLFEKKRLTKTKARIAARPTGRAAGGGAGLWLAGAGLVAFGLLVGTRHR